MSRRTKRKHVLKEVLEDDLSLPTNNQTIVKVISSVGNNLHKISTPDQQTYLVSMPTKFRKNVWIKRGNYVLVEPIKEGDKVKAEIVRILTKDHIKYFKIDNVWPPEFDDCKADKSENLNSEDNDDLPANPNRPQSDQSDDTELSDDES